jgi:Sortilin, neurotensin receptor 3,
MPPNTAPGSYTNMFKIVGFAVQDSYMLAAVPDLEGGSVGIRISTNGAEWVNSTFPSGLSTRGGFTLLPSEMGGVYMQIYQSVNAGEESGSLVRSDMSAIGVFKELVSEVL